MKSALFLLKLTILFLLIFSLKAFSSNNKDYSNKLEKDSLTNLFQKYIPDNSEITDISQGYLNEDTLTDYVIVSRDSVDWDNNKLLIILFQDNNKAFIKSVETDIFPTRYDCHTRINNKILTIHSLYPWNGMNEYEYEIKYVSNDWYCLRVSTQCGYTEDYWENSFDFTSGKYLIKHTIYLKNEESQAREIRGLAENSKPFSIIIDDISKHLEVENHGKKYCVYGRCDLWTYDEIKRLNEDK